jgi:hypothetical protein
LRLSRAQWRFADQSFIRPFEQRGHKGPVDNQTYLINLKGEALASNSAAERLPGRPQFAVRLGDGVCRSWRGPGSFIRLWEGLT